MWVVRLCHNGRTVLHVRLNRMSVVERQGTSIGFHYYLHVGCTVLYFLLTALTGAVLVQVG
jgi:hypothetical protein